MIPPMTMKEVPTAIPDCLFVKGSAKTPAPTAVVTRMKIVPRMDPLPQGPQVLANQPLLSST